jgi:DNA primase
LTFQKEVAVARFLDFQEISKQVKFKDLLDALSLPYTETREGLKGNGKFSFVVSEDKNLFICPTLPIKGSVINFYSEHAGVTLREAAEWLFDTFLNTEKKPKKEAKKFPMYELTYNEAIKATGITEEECKEWECGYVKKGVMAGRFGFLIRDKESNPVAWIGRMTKDGQKPWYTYDAEPYKHLYGFKRLKDHSFAVVVANPIEVILLARFEIPAVAMMSLAMTEQQAQLLEGIGRLLVLIPKPEASANIANRMSKHCYVKAPKLAKAVKEYTEEELKRIV